MRIRRLLTGLVVTLFATTAVIPAPVSAYEAQDLLAKHITGYAEMPRHDVGSFLILYLANLPWLAGMGWLASDAAREISRVFRRVEGTTHAI